MESMGKKRRRRSFTPEFKAEIVELCQRGDRSVGASAPALLRQLGALRGLDEQPHDGTVLEIAASKEKTDTASVQAEEG
jgi:transposase